MISSTGLSASTKANAGISPVEPRPESTSPTDGLRASATVGDLLDRTANRYPGRVALIDAWDPAQRWTWAELHGAAVAGARGLAASHAPGQVVAIWAPSEPAWVVLELACALAGLIVQPIDPSQNTRRSGRGVTAHGRSAAGRRG